MDKMPESFTHETFIEEYDMLDHVKGQCDYEPA